MSDEHLAKKFTVAVDFDGVIHSYTTLWFTASVIPDPPVPGAIEWLCGSTSVRLSCCTRRRDDA